LSLYDKVIGVSQRFGFEGDFERLLVPMFIKDSKQVIRIEMLMARTGIFQLGETWESQWENGRPAREMSACKIDPIQHAAKNFQPYLPLSRAKDHSWRDDVATSLIAAEIIMVVMIATITVAPA
jgi:hypothetical protein